MSLWGWVRKKARNFPLWDVTWVLILKGKERRQKATLSCEAVSSLLFRIGVRMEHSFRPEIQRVSKHWAQGFVPPTRDLGGRNSGATQRAPLGAPLLSWTGLCLYFRFCDAFPKLPLEHFQKYFTYNVEVIASDGKLMARMVEFLLMGLLRIHLSKNNYVNITIIFLPLFVGKGLLK